MIPSWSEHTPATPSLRRGLPLVTLPDEPHATSEESKPRSGACSGQLTSILISRLSNEISF